MEQKTPEKKDVSTYMKFKLQAKQARTGVSTAALLMLGDCPVHGGMRTTSSGLDPLDARSIPPSCDNHKCLQTLPSVP